MPDSDPPHWVRAAPLERVRTAGRTVAKIDSRQIALFAIGDRVYACNNRCPHEGYPLVEGQIADGVPCRLTCHYHNWSFDLANGDNLYGGDRLRIYPTRIDDGAVWVDVRDPPRGARIAATLASLREAFDDHDYARLARELARLARLGADPLDAVRAAIGWSHDRLEDGTTHAFAAAAGWLRLHAEAQDDEMRLICLQECLGHMAWDALRQPAFPYATDVRAYDEAQFRAAIEARDEPRAIALLRGALAKGRGIAELERTLTQAALAHYADFGHSLIYLVHTRALIERLGRAVEAPLLLALVRSYVRATREDLLPDFRGYADALAAWPAARGQATDTAAPSSPVTVKQAVQQTLADAGRLEPAALYRRLLFANAHNLQHFDTAFEQLALDKPGEDVGWLDVTHGLTFANAVRVQCERFSAFWPQGLLQMALFAGRNARYTAEEPSAAPVNADAFDKEALDRVLDHGIGLYIHSAHKLKTWLAARDEIAAGAPPDIAAALRAGVGRYLHANVKQKHTLRAARLALAFVAREQ
jgi:nitrite reductase/ring-hydroxylating ferredoxin subunit